MTFADALGAHTGAQDAHERLIMDIVRGDQTLFMRVDGVEAARAWGDPIIRRRDEDRQSPAPCDTGSSGPEDALMLLHRDGRRWRFRSPIMKAGLCFEFSLPVMSTSSFHRERGDPG